MISALTFVSVINQVLPEPSASLLNGIVFGVKSGIPTYVTNALTVTGTLYIVDLSGMKLAILASLLGKMLERVINKRIASIITIVCMIGFIALVGVTPGVVRAAIMATLALLATIFGRQKWSLLFFFIAIAIMLLFNPSWITNLSFQISSLASLGIILFYKSSIHAKKPVLAFIENNFRLTLAAQSLTIPLIFFTFHQVSVISPVTNVLIGWLMQPLFALGLLAALAGWIFFPLGQVFAWVAFPLLQYILWVVLATAKLPFASISW